MIFIICSILGILPSTIWLMFFLREDVHPESNKMIVKVFCYGIVAAFFAALFEIDFKLAQDLFFPSAAFILLEIFIGISFIEEFLKFIVVREVATRDSEFDEPLDAMLYMVIAGLGFAAIENILYLLPFGAPFDLPFTLTLTVFRFLGATFLHAIASGTLGFFLALSFYETKHRYKLIFAGIFLATLLHGLYNFSIIKLGDDYNLFLALTPVILLVGAGIFVLLGFKKLKTMSSVCKIKKS